MADVGFSSGFLLLLPTDSLHPATQQRVVPASDLPESIMDSAAFHAAVYGAVRAVPHGRVTSYGQRPPLDLCGFCPTFFMQGMSPS